jgi:cell fate (sporulation/competence/biofilm development) regulator YmcA (YheA/YmcA/DUF963 family)
MDAFISIEIMPKRINITELSETIEEIVKTTNIQKAKVDQNKMIEEIQEEIAKFQKQVVEVEKLGFSTRGGITLRSDGL